MKHEMPPALSMLAAVVVYVLAPFPAGFFETDRTGTVLREMAAQRNRLSTLTSFGVYGLSALATCSTSAPAPTGFDRKARAPNWIERSRRRSSWKPVITLGPRDKIRRFPDH